MSRCRMIDARNSMLDASAFAEATADKRYSRLVSKCGFFCLFLSVGARYILHPSGDEFFHLVQITAVNDMRSHTFDYLRSYQRGGRTR